MDRERFPRPATLSLGENLYTLIDHKLTETFANYGLSEREFAEIMRNGCLDLIRRDMPLPLLEADSFYVDTVRIHDRKDGVEDRQPVMSADVYMFNDGSPFVFDADYELGVEGLTYALLIGPDAAPTLIHVDLLKQVRDDEKALNYGEDWHGFSKVRQTFGDGVVHTLTDLNCNDIFLAVANSEVDVNYVVMRIPPSLT